VLKINNGGYTYGNVGTVCNIYSIYFFNSIHIFIFIAAIFKIVCVKWLY